MYPIYDGKNEALKILHAPTELETYLLKEFKYQKNIATLHTDSSVMPKIRSAWSSWNYRIEKKNGSLTTSTVYYMNSLQNVSDKKDYFVSINDPGNVNPDKILKKIEYEHPLYCLENHGMSLIGNRTFHHRFLLIVLPLLILFQE